MKSFLYSTFLLLFACLVNAQVGIGTTTPSSTLDVTAANPTGVTSNVDGILIPRVSRERAQSMTGTPTSTLIYINEVVTGTATGTTINVTTVGFYFFNGTVWEKLKTGTSTDWAITGNTGTSSTTNFLGTTDDIDLIFRRNNIRAGFVGDPVYDGSFNSNNGNTSFGANSLVNPTINIASQTGVRNAAFGANVMPSLSTGQRNTGIGDFSLFSNTSGSENIAVGSGALYSNTISSGHVAIGRSALTSYIGPATANIGNTAVGFTSLRDNLVGTGNSALGYRALRASTGSNNTAIGFDAGLALTTGSNNIMIGANTVAPVVAGSDQLNIGNTIFGSMAGALTTGVNTTRSIGINVLAPLAALDVTSTTDGLLIPRVELSATNVATVTTPTVSELVYNTFTSAVGSNQVTPGFYYWDGSLWLRLAVGTASNDWSITGNTNIVNGTHFMGTGASTDVDVAFRRNNLAAGRIGATSTNFGLASANANTAAGTTAFGVSALAVNIGATGSTAVGYQALANSNANNNTAIGYQAGDQLSTADVTAIGYGALGAAAGAGSVAVGSLAGSASTGANLVAIGYNAGNTVTGAGVIAIGAQAGALLTTTNAIAIGTNAFNDNNDSASQYSIAIGADAMGGSTGVAAHNVAIGWQALQGTTASNNVAIGGQAALQVTSGFDNVAVGYNAMLQGNSQQNVAIGRDTLKESPGNGNTAIGFEAGKDTPGSNNVFIGYQSNGTGTTTNAISIGYQVNTTASNTIRIGNAAMTNSYVQIAWTATSDRRYKSDIKDSALGLDFLKTLRPVSYFRNNDPKKKTEYGFIAQEVEQAFINVGDTNNGVVDVVDDNDRMLGLRYNDFIPMTVKAIQEQQAQIEELKKANAELLKVNTAIMARLEKLEKK
jgi:trimeric autotransporter adhesin